MSRGAAASEPGDFMHGFAAPFAFHLFDVCVCVHVGVSWCELARHDAKNFGLWHCRSADSEEASAASEVTPSEGEGDMAFDDEEEETTDDEGGSGRSKRKGKEAAGEGGSSRSSSRPVRSARANRKKIYQDPDTDDDDFEAEGDGGDESDEY